MNYPPLIELAARKLCTMDGRDPDAHCPEAPRVGNKKPRNFEMAASAVYQHLSIQSALIAARAEMMEAEKPAQDSPDSP